MTAANPMPSPARVAASAESRFVPIMLVLFFIGCTAFFVFVVGAAAWQEFRPFPNGKADGALTDSKDQILSVKLDAYNKHAEEIEKLAASLTGLSVLYALALGVGSYLGLQQAKAVSDELNALRDKAVK
jgi:hypothetical protein